VTVFGPPSALTTDSKSRPRLPLGSVRSMAELLRHSGPRGGNERPWTRGPRPRGQRLATRTHVEEVPWETGDQGRCATSSALTSQNRPMSSARSRPQAERSGSSRVRLRRAQAATLVCRDGWRAGQNQKAILTGMEATGTLWEPLYDTLTQAGALTRRIPQPVVSQQ